ncbi:MAG: hypothetical protein WDN69_23555 [Aliidongia sp.]
MDSSAVAPGDGLVPVFGIDGFVPPELPLWPGIVWPELPPGEVEPADPAGEPPALPALPVPAPPALPAPPLPAAYAHRLEDASSSATAAAPSSCLGFIRAL